MEPELVEVTSADGSLIGAERLGSGPALVAVHGSTADRTRWAPVREALAESYTLFLLDRRGRGASLREAGAGYALRREVEDVRAVIDAIDGPVFYLGHSYGALVGTALLQVETRIAKAVLYEPPFDSGGHEVVPLEFREHYARLIEQDRRDEALDAFYTSVIGVDPQPLHALPIWQARKLAAHTLVREGEVAAAYAPDLDGLAQVQTPTLVLTGELSPPVFGAAARLTAEALPRATLRVVPAQGHAMIDTDPDGFVAIVREFLR